MNNCQKTDSDLIGEFTKSDNLSERIIEVAKQLRDINMIMKDTSETLLDEAASQNAIQAIEWLVKNGAKIEIGDQTSLTCAVLNGQVEAAKKLIELGAKYEINDMVETVIEGFFIDLSISINSFGQILETLGTTGKDYDWKQHEEKISFELDNAIDTGLNGIIPSDKFRKIASHVLKKIFSA